MTEVHLSQRAVDWLLRAETFQVGRWFYTEEPGTLACPRPWLRHKALGRAHVCGVEDARALHLGEPLKLAWRGVPLNLFHADGGTGTQWVFVPAPIVVPTCATCGVMLDYALEHARAKSGNVLRQRTAVTTRLVECERLAPVRSLELRWEVIEESPAVFVGEPLSTRKHASDKVSK